VQDVTQSVWVGCRHPLKGFAGVVSSSSVVVLVSDYVQIDDKVILVQCLFDDCSGNKVCCGTICEARKYKPEEFEVCRPATVTSSNVDVARNLVNLSHSNLNIQNHSQSSHSGLVVVSASKPQSRNGSLNVIDSRALDRLDALEEAFQNLVRGYLLSKSRSLKQRATLHLPGQKSRSNEPELRF